MKLQIILLNAALASCAAADCTRDFLVNATDRYVAAQAAGKPATLTAITAANLNYTESDKTVDIKTGVLAQPMKIDHNRSIHDTTLCATFTELIVTDPAKPYVIATRMVFTNNTATLIETIASKPGDWAFNATSYLHWDSLETWSPIPPAQRDTRATIQAAGDAYFNRFDNASLTVPFGTPCARLEGGAYTDARLSGNDTCGLGLPSSIVVTNRRYVVDETMGVVSIFLGLPGLDRSVPSVAVPDSHVFRVEAGRIRYIHTVSACVHAGCGLNGTGIPS